ncbi:MAG: FKBP-type peptidyl-prolyl cis-trans isomerase [Planctomycetota bacterium]|jgi:FKBP-type peptidyl-prolyl cis-trans isomerase
MFQNAAILGLLIGTCACTSHPQTYSPRRLESGLTVQEIVVPNSLTAKDGDTVSIHYHGTLPGGQVFDSSVDRGQPLDFKLGDQVVPPGLEQGVRGMRLHGRRKLTAPIELMFPAGAPDDLMVFELVYLEIELLSIERSE